MTLALMARLRMIRESIRAHEFSQRIQARPGGDRPDSAATASTEAAAEGGAEATAALKRALDTEAAAARRQALSAQVPLSSDALGAFYKCGTLSPETLAFPFKLAEAGAESAGRGGAAAFAGRGDGGPAAARTAGV